MPVVQGVRGVRGVEGRIERRDEIRPEVASPKRPKSLPREPREESADGHLPGVRIHRADSGEPTEGAVPEDVRLVRGDDRIPNQAPGRVRRQPAPSRPGAWARRECSEPRDELESSAVARLAGGDLADPDGGREGSLVRGPRPEHAGERNDAIGSVVGTCESIFGVPRVELQAAHAHESSVTSIASPVAWSRSLDRATPRFSRRSSASGGGTRPAAGLRAALSRQGAARSGVAGILRRGRGRRDRGPRPVGPRCHAFCTRGRQDGRHRAVLFAPRAPALGPGTGARWTETRGRAHRGASSAVPTAARRWPVGPQRARGVPSSPAPRLESRRPAGQPRLPLGATGVVPRTNGARPEGQLGRPRGPAPGDPQGEPRRTRGAHPGEGGHPRRNRRTRALTRARSPARAKVSGT